MAKNPFKHLLEKILGIGTAEQAHSLYYYTDVVHEKWIDISAREIWIHGVDTDPLYYDSEEPGVEYNMATKVIKNLHILKNISRTEPITIHLHSCGGIVEEGMAIYDAIKMMPYKVTMISYTHARSMSSYILQAADNRYLLPHSCFMFHRGSLYLAGEAQEVESNFLWAKELDKRLMEIYIDKLKEKGKFKNKSRDYIKEMIIDLMNKRTDVFLTAEKAVEWGFADKVIEKF